jgi:hypothetical protein
MCTCFVHKKCLFYATNGQSELAVFGLEMEWYSKKKENQKLMNDSIVMNGQKLFF